MNPLNNDVDYSSFGGTRLEEEPNQQIEDYSQFGGEPIKPEKKKVGSFKSALYGVTEGVLGVLGVREAAQNKLGELGVNTLAKVLPKDEEGNTPKAKPKENTILGLTSTFPESKDQTARRVRAGFQALPLSVFGGIPGIVAGLVGSQAGQTIREVFGKEGKFENFGLGEAVALGTDVVTGLGAGIGTSLIKAGTKAVAAETPAIFRNAETGLQKKVVQHAIQAEENSLQKVINDFSQKQLRGFEEEATRISPERFTSMTQSNASALKRNADQMFRNTQLNIISPISATPEQGGRAMQEAANVTFQNEVLTGERQAYTAARESSQGLSGKAPKTLVEAKALRANLTRNEPTPEQRPLITFLDGLIEDLETTTAASTTPASKVLNAQGKPAVAAVENAATSEATTRSANDLVDLVQRSNQVVNYGGELREQSHRLAPVIATLRSETGEVLAQKAEAAKLYNDANLLHARNAQVWGTKYMRNVRFNENPESIIGTTKKASNMRNFKQGVQDPNIQALAERMVVSNITEGGTSNANRTAVNNLSPELSPVARNSASQLIDVKDPLTTIGGRAAIRNDILKDAAQSVNMGKRPEKILDLMQTPKGYQMVREALSSSPQSKELFKTYERLFLEDVMSSITDKSGVIDFTKASAILKNPEMKQVLHQIGGDKLIRRLDQLETFSNNFNKNLALYSRPEAQSLVKSLLKDSKKDIPLALLFHALHMPWPVIVGLGLAKAGSKIGKASYKALEKIIFSNPKAIHYLERVSEAATTQELAKQLPRLLSEIDKD